MVSTSVTGCLKLMKGSRYQERKIISNMNAQQNKGEIVIYQTEDGQTSLEVSLVEDTAWLSLNHMVALFDRDKSVISRHIKNIFREDELDKRSVVAKYATTAADGKTYNID